MVLSGMGGFSLERAQSRGSPATAEGRADAVLAVLAARRIEVPEEARARIAACTDLVLLDRWVARAANARSLDDVLRD